METKKEIKLEDVFNDEKRQAIKEFIDKQEIKHIIPKELFLLRGLPGSGKSTLAKSLSNALTGYVEADMFFMRDGEYKFDPNVLPLAHAWCQNKVRNWMGEYGLDEIIVSNTFTQEWELKPYYKLAEEHGYIVFSVIVENRHGGENEHGVPDDKLEQMKNRFEVRL
jgi:energy-coupling factor transporter ATP-binding protein EcfA2